MAKGTILELSELPESWADYCRKRRPDLKPYEVWEDFRTYWTETRKPMESWLATWQGWVRRAAKNPLFKAGEISSPRVYKEPAALPKPNPDSRAYKEFQERLERLKAKSAAVQHPRFVSFTHIGDALLADLRARERSEAEMEWDEERIAIEQEGCRRL